jgi:hypothetical protein
VPRTWPKREEISRRIAAAQGALGVALQASGADPEARDALEESLASARAAPDPALEATTLNNLGNLLAGKIGAAAAVGEALESYDDAERIALANGRPDLAGRSSLNAAGLLGGRVTGRLRPIACAARLICWRRHRRRRVGPGSWSQPARSPVRSTTPAIGRMPACSRTICSPGRPGWPTAPGMRACSPMRSVRSASFTWRKNGSMRPLR